MRCGRYWKIYSSCSLSCGPDLVEGGGGGGGGRTVVVVPIPLRQRGKEMN